MNNTAFYFALYVLSVVVASFSQILLKKSATKQYTSVIREYLNLYVILGYGMMFGSMLLTILAFKGIEFKNGAIIESLGYVLFILLSRLFFQEKITRNKLAGTLFILLGITIYYL